MENEIHDEPKKNKGGRPKGSTKNKVAAASVSPEILNTPEVQILISNAIEAKFAELMASLGDKREDAGTPAEEGDMKLVRQLALAIGEISDQGAKTKKVAPAEMEARNEARAKMEDLILDAAANEKVATYELTRQVYLDEVLVNPTYVNAMHVVCVQSIDWPGVPDESMRPVNETAEKIHAALVRSTGGRTKEAKVSYKRAEQAPGLRVHGQPERARTAPEVGAGRLRGSDGLKVHRPGMPGEMPSVRVLGTLAEPARQIG